MPGTKIINSNMNLLLMQPVKQFSDVFIPHHGSLSNIKHIVKVSRRHGIKPVQHILTETTVSQMQGRNVATQAGMTGNGMTQQMCVSRETS